MSAVERRTYGLGGAALSSLEAGPEDGETVVLLHGIPASAELWRGVAEGLAARGLRAVAFDLPGYGQTLVPARADHSLAGAAELVALWLRVEVGRPVWLVGHDLGGGVAQILASRHPQLLAGLTLSDTVVGSNWPVPPVRLWRMLARSGAYPALGATPLIPNAAMRTQLRRGFADASRLTPELEERVFWDEKVRDADGRRAFARHLVALDPRQTEAALGNLTRLTVASQLVWGVDDVLLPFEEGGRRLAEQLPGPEVRLLADAGHFCPLEQPGRFAEAVAAGTAGVW